MNFYRVKEQLQYRWNAKTRHGVHSPFVFELIEKALRPALPATEKKIISRESADGYSIPKLELIYRMLHYFKPKNLGYYGADKNTAAQIIRLANAAGVGLAGAHDADFPPANFDSIIISSLPEEWIFFYENELPLFPHLDFLLFTGIHETPYHRTQWEAIYKQKNVRLSIDLFHIGLLFFKNDFKEKQHFVLKYPA